MRATVRKANTYLSVQYAAMLEYRMEIFLWAISTVLPLIMMGLLLANGKRTITSWLRAAGLQDEFREYYYFL